MLMLGSGCAKHYALQFDHHLFWLLSIGRLKQ
jgi:hypothetical protein